MSDNSSNNKRIAKNTIFLYARMIVVLFVSLYTTRVVLNVLGIVDYGIYNVVAGFVSMFAFLNSALNNTTQRFLNFEKKNDKSGNLVGVFNASLRIQLLLAIVIFILLESFGIWYIYNKMIIPEERLSAANCVFQCSSISLILLVLQVPYSASIIAHEKMDYYAFVSIIDVILKLLIVLILPYVGFDKLAFYGVTSLLVSLLNFFLYFIYSKKNFKEITLQKDFDKERFTKMLSFTGWNVFGSFAFMIQGQGLNVLMNSFFGPAINAARGVAFQIQGAINGFSENIATAFRPQLVGSYANEDYKRTEDLMFAMSKYCFLMLCTLSLPIAVELPYILNLWLNGVVPDYTIIFSVLVLVNMVLNSLNMPISQTVQATGYVRNYQLIRSALVASSLPIAWFFLQLGCSPTAVFIVTLGITLINQPVSMIILHSNFAYSYSHYITKVIIPCGTFLILSLIVPLTLHNLMQESIVRLCSVVVFSIIFSIVVAYYVVLGVSEKKFIKSTLLNKFLKK